MIEKSNGIVAVTEAIVPDEALPDAKIIGAIPVEPLVQRLTLAGHPIGLAADRPAIAQVSILMEMDFINVDQPQLPLVNLLIPSLKLGDKGGALIWISFG